MKKNMIEKIKNILKKILNPVSAKADVKRSHIIQLLVGLVLIVFINVVGAYVFGRLDLTQEKRYSLSDSTKKMLKKVDDVVFVRCYLDGDLPANYKSLRNETRDMLNQFRSYNSNIEYEFTDPNGFKDKKDQADFYQRLFEKGFRPIMINTTTSSSQVQQYIFPYVEISYGGRSTIVSLISTKQGFSEDEVIASSIQNLEYNLYSSISSLMKGMKKDIAFLYGQGEVDVPYLFDIIQTLNETYSIDSLTINGKIDALTQRRYDSVDNTKIKFRNKYSCLIVAKPTQPFTYKDLYIIDQYIMRGGKVLWLVDPLTADMDSIQSKAKTLAVSNITGVEDPLFKYGVRMNTNLVMDLQCVQVPIVTGEYGNNQPQMTYYPWNFFPEISPNSANIITDKINPIKMMFVSTMDTVDNGSTAIKKTPLLFTSRNTRLLNAPAEVSLQMLKQKQDPRLFNQGSLMVAMLLEGRFTSAFKNMLSSDMTDNPLLANRDMSDSTAMIVVGDGDLIKNDFINGQVVPLGYDKYTKQMFGNKEFLVNCVNYLCGDQDLIPLRSREVIVRKLDMAKIDREKTFWEVFNIISPLLVIAILGTVVVIIRKKLYTR